MDKEKAKSMLLGARNNIKIIEMNLEEGKAMVERIEADIKKMVPKEDWEEVGLIEK